MQNENLGKEGRAGIMRDDIEQDEETLRRYVGRMQQVAGVESSVLADGRGRGMRVWRVDNGGGLSYTILPDRGLDIGRASFNGTSLCYETPAGPVHPAYTEPGGFGWLRTFGGGLMTGCGLTQVGSPVPTDEQALSGPLGLHGRLSSLPAEDVCVTQQWEGGRYVLRVAGLVRESGFFSENLELHRTIETALGENEIRVSDTVVNRGPRTTPFMLLYHINTGYPLLQDSSYLDADSLHTKARNAHAADGLGAWNRFQAPERGFVEQCYFHDIREDQEGMAAVTLQSPATGYFFRVCYRKRELPYLTQWKMMGEQEYACGLEPANCYPEGRETERSEGRLRLLEPGESVDHLVVLQVGLRS